MDRLIMTEAELQEHVRYMCAQLGLYHYHPHDSRRSQGGWPDSAMINLRTGAIMYRELKGTTGQLTREQRLVGYAMRAGCHDWDVWRPEDLACGRIARELAALARYGPGA